jgi:arginyl-tRNA synthetase
MFMDTPYSALRAGIARLIDEAADKLGYGDANSFDTIDFSEQFGDLSSSVAFRIAKERKKSANEIATALASSLGKSEYVSKTEVKNGFINFGINRGRFAKAVVEHALDKKESVVKSDIGKGRKVIIEYPSVNPAHPWHIGHLRSAFLGDVISNAYEACGYEVEREDYIDDMGLQVGQAVWGQMNDELIKIGSESGKKFDHWLGDLYVAVNAYAKEHDITDQVKETLTHMEQDGTYENEIASKLTEQCVRSYYQTSFDYNVYHDILVWESDILRERLFEKSLEMLKSKGVATFIENGDYAQCTVINFEKMKDLPKEFQGMKEKVKVLVRSNGVPTYVAKDIAFHMWKLGLLQNTFKYSKFIEKQPNGKTLYTTHRDGIHLNYGNVDRAINFIDARQSSEQETVRLALNALGEKKAAEGLMHVAYGLVALEEGTVSARKGTGTGYSADELLREAEVKALTLIKDRFEFNSSEQERIARNVALSAIRFEYLKVSPERKVIFSWSKALDLEGNSGPYAQYTYARATRILENAKAEESRSADFAKITDVEFDLIKLISKAGAIMEKTCNEYRPNIITEYINSMAHTFATFYEQSPVLKAESEELKRSRLALVSAFVSIMKGALGILGIEPLERM